MRIRIYYTDDAQRSLGKPELESVSLANSGDGEFPVQATQTALRWLSVEGAPKWSAVEMVEVQSYHVVFNL